jgi:hypothetical protein
MKAFVDAIRTTDRNKMSLVLSVIPGLGHLYKRHMGSGIAILVAGNALMIFVTLWLSMATLGLSLILVPAAWWVGIAAAAYYAEDRHTHDPAPPPTMGARPGR